MKIEYQIKGVTLDVHDMIEVSNYFAAACTAELILEEYGVYVKTEDQALDIGYEVRRKMDKYGYGEQEAIERAMDEYFGVA